MTETRRVENAINVLLWSVDEHPRSLRVLRKRYKRLLKPTGEIFRESDFRAAICQSVDGNAVEWTEDGKVKARDK